MAKLNINIPNTKVELLKAAIGYPETVMQEDPENAGEMIEVANPQTPQDYAEKWIISQLRGAVVSYEKEKAKVTATLTDTSDFTQV